MTNFLSPIVGAHFRPPAKILLELLPQGAALWLRPEPSNQFDPNAIQVIVEGEVFDLDDLSANADDLERYGTTPEEVVEREWHLGYIPKTEAATLIRRLNAAIEIRASEEHSGPAGTWPATFDFTLEGKPAAQYDLPSASA